MRKPLVLFLGLILICAPISSFAHGEKVVSETLTKTTDTWAKTQLPAYPQGQPEVTVLKITIPPKSRLPWHKHTVINCGYMLKGELQVTADDGTTALIREGETIVELVEKWHFGENLTDEPVTILVFYAGTKDHPITLLKPE